MNFKNLLLSLDSIAEPKQTQLNEAINIQVDGEDAANLMRMLKLSGVETPTASVVSSSCGSAMATEEQYANSPDEHEFPLEAMLDAGDDLHRSKRQYPATQPGDNPMAAFESRLAEITAQILGETRYESDIDENDPVRVTGVRGAKSQPFSKRFRNTAAYSKWADSEAADDYEVHSVEKA